MASTLLTLLSQTTPSLQTRKGLILVGLQNDLLPQGKLPVSVPPGYFDRLRKLVSDFREYGDVIWVRSEFETNREVNTGDDGDTVLIGPVPETRYYDDDEEDNERDSPVPPKRRRVSLEDSDDTTTADGEDVVNGVLHSAVDEELFLTQTNTKQACCLSGSSGAEYPPYVKDMIDMNNDMDITSTHYSAFGSTSLLLTLRSKLITDLFICGGLTNLNVYATAMDAARYGLQITLIGDCLLARNPVRHDSAITCLRENLEADVMTSNEVIDVLRNPSSPGEEEVVYKVQYDERKGDPWEGRMIVPDEFEEDDDDDAPAALEVDSDANEDEDTWSLDPSASHPVTSYIYNHLESPRPPSRRTYATTPAEATLSTHETKTPGRAVTNTGSSDEAVYDHMDTSEPEAQSSRGRGEKLSESKVAETAEASQSDRMAGDESSGSVSVQGWLERSKKATKPSASSKHPGLSAIASLACLDQKTVDSYEELMAETNDAKRSDQRPLFGDGKDIESAGSCILYDLLTPEFAGSVFDELNGEISWQRMMHKSGEVPRLVCCQGTIGEDGSMPVYRHPSDQTLPIQSWTPVVDKVRKATEDAVGHPLNHALIQLYRSGTDYISEHSDKTLDVVKGSYIVNVSFGAQRTMRLRTKRAALTTADGTTAARTTYRIPMLHNSMIKMSLETNAEYLHGINADKRDAVELSEAESAFDGQRISLTFRNIGTFLSRDSSLIWGQGATGKTKELARDVINADPDASERLVRAFGTENQSSTIQWDDIYGNGFDVLHLT